MLFKKLTALPLKDGFTLTLSDLEAAVTKAPARECQFSETERLGFDHVFEGSRLRVWPIENEKVMYLRLTEYKRLLPSSVLNDELDKKCRKLEEETGEKVKGKARRDLKDQLKQELLGKAFQKKKAIQVMINLLDGELWVDETSEATVSKVRKLLAKVIGEIPIEAATSAETLAKLMKEWLLDEGSIPAGIEILDKAKLVDTHDPKASMAAKGEELHSEEFQALLGHREVVELGVAIGRAVSCQLSPNQLLKGIKSDTPANDNDSADEDTGLDERFDSELYLTFAELREARHLIARLAMNGADQGAQKEAS